MPGKWQDNDDNFEENGGELLTTPGQWGQWVAVGGFIPGITPASARQRGLTFNHEDYQL